ncbi:MAG: hypothetical protein ABF811_01330 [Pseudoclavibacter sp.]
MEQTYIGDIATAGETNRRLFTAIGGYLHHGHIGFAADHTGVSRSELVTGIAIVFLQARGKLDEAAHRYGARYTRAEVASIVKQIHHGVPLPAIAERLGRNQLGVAWKALDQPEVLALLRERRVPLAPMALVWLALARWGFALAGDDTATGCISVEELLDPDLRTLLDGRPGRDTPTADDAAEFANAAIRDEPLGTLGIWVDLQRMSERPHWYSRKTVPKMDVKVHVLAGKWALDGAIGAFTEPGPESGSAVVFDAIDRQYLTPSHVLHPANVFTNVPRAIVRSEITTEEHLGAPFWPENDPLDPRREQRIIDGLVEGRHALQRTLPVFIVIGGKQDRARRMLNRG